jgi:hypothetical protein
MHGISERCQTHPLDTERGTELGATLQSYISKDLAAHIADEETSQQWFEEGLDKRTVEGIRTSAKKMQT